MLEKAMAKAPGAEFKQGSYYELPYPDDSFDYVVETNGLSGVGIDAEKALAEMIRVCKVGGARSSSLTGPLRRRRRLESGCS